MEAGAGMMRVGKPMTRKELHTSVLKDVSHRETWESRQRVWYEMRHDGLRRRNKEDWQADLHHPLSDTIIGKLKPYYFEQLFSTDTLATFLSLRPQTRGVATTASQWHDHKVKQRSNLETEIVAVIDHMLMSGRSVIKCTWDAEQKRLHHEAVEPHRVIVPYGTRDLDTCDRFVHVLNISDAAYRRNGNYRQDLLPKIVGKGSDDVGDSEELRQEKELREGITHTEKNDRVVLWECYTRAAGGGWKVETFAPVLPEENVRQEFVLPYEHGELPFVDFPAELKDAGWYSPRGVVEMVAPFETALCKTWNEKLDSMTLYNRPGFTSDDPGASSANIRMVPGQIFPFNIRPISHGNPPVSWDQEMVSTRMVAEQRVAVPDFGLGQAINTKDRKTATEVNALSQMMGNVGDLRMRIFRKSLSRLYRQQWRLLLQYDKEGLDFLYRENLGQLPPDAMHPDYEIMPSGSLDGVNKSYLLQKAVTRFQMFNQDPFIEQYELRKGVLELDDPALVRTHLVDPGTKRQDAAEDQATEIVTLKEGFPVRVKPTDDHEAHIGTILQYLEAQGQMGKPADPTAVQRITEHLGQHVEAIEQQDPAKGRQIRQTLEQLAGPSAAGGETVGVEA